MGEGGIRDSTISSELGGGGALGTLLYPVSCGGGGLVTLGTLLYLVSCGGGN